MVCWLGDAQDQVKCMKIKGRNLFRIVPEVRGRLSGNENREAHDYFSHLFAGILRVLFALQEFVRF
jgi:hypothetical protein